jgi:hypothetical protein
MHVRLSTPACRYNEVTGEVSAKDPTAAVRGFGSKSGHLYWLDPETGDTTWERPAAYSWKEEPSNEHAGHTYFYNMVRQRSGHASFALDLPHR